MNTCDTCTHWNQKDSMPNCGICEKLTKAPNGSKVIVSEDFATITTESKFGCIHHKEKAKPVEVFWVKDEGFYLSLEAATKYAPGRTCIRFREVIE